MQNVFVQLTNLLKKDERLVSQDGLLLKNQVQELARKNDPQLIKLILSDATIKKHFFFEVERTLIFDKEKFIRFVSNKQFLPDSYTAFKNKIGLTTGDEYLSENKEVVLVWPYKDCILEGGMTKEDQKRDEIFYNETLAPDDIDRLLDPKVFTNFKRIDKGGEHKLDGFKRDEKGVIKDNLIIKGNNLLALASLKKEFAGKVKLIYIDPPYNTDGDGFNYNDNFNHSTWLTFLKNRFEIAKDLLAKDGIIFVQIDYIEFAYLKVLLDEIFGSDKALPHVTIRTATPAGFKVVNPGFINVSEQLLIYVRDRRDVIKNGYTPTEYQSDYSKYILDKNKPADRWEVVNIRDATLLEAEYPNFQDLVKAVGDQVAPYVLKDLISKFAVKHSDNVFATYAPHKPSKSLQSAIEKSKENPNIIFHATRNSEDKDAYYLLNGRLLAFYSSKLKEIDGTIVPTQRLTDFWADLSWDSLSNEGGVSLKNGKKPEKLLKRIIELTTEYGDLVLDFFAGSGTTCAVAHKMKRQYAGIEQLDYGQNDGTTRLKNVINGDQSGISKAVSWKGGGDFVYMELAKWNEAWIEKIEKAKTAAELTKLWDEMKENAFLSYKVDLKTIDANAKEITNLSIADQKKFLIECLDKNQLYINYSEIEDKDYEVSKENRDLNKEFYG